MTFTTRSARDQNVGCKGNDGCAGVRVLFVRESAALARMGLDQDLMPRFTQSRGAARNQADARFVIFDFFRDADDHAVILPLDRMNPMSPELIEHFRNPRNVGELPPPAVTVEVSNPICGDILRLSALIEDGRVAESRFKVRGLHGFHRGGLGAHRTDRRARQSRAEER